MPNLGRMPTRRPQITYNELPKTLINAHKAAESELLKATAEAEKKHIAAEAPLLLSQIRDQLAKILDQRTWLESITKFVSLQNITQSTMLEKAKETYLMALQETYHQLARLEELNTQYRSLTMQRNSFSHYLQECTKSSRNFLIQSMSDTGENFYSPDKPTFIVAAGLNGRFFPFNQAADPLLINRGKGACFGDTYNWIMQVKSNKNKLHPLSADIKTMKQQKTQKKIKKLLAENHLMSNILENNYHNFFDIWKISHQITHSLQTRNIYSLNYIFGKENHILGLRQIPESKEIEFRDSNQGHFVFKTSQDFQKFFYLNFSSFYFPKVKHGIIAVNSFGKQPANTKASLPIIINDLPQVFHFQQTPSLDSFYTRIQYGATLVIKNKLDNTHFTETTTEEVTRENKNFSQQLREKFNFVSPESKDFDLELPTISKTPVLAAVDTEIARDRRSAISLQRLRTQIEIAPSGATLMAIVDEWLKGKMPSPFIENLVKNYEINPCALFILQEKVLKKLSHMIMREWTHLMPLFSGGRLHPTQGKRPKTCELVRECFRDYCTENPNNLFQLTANIQQIFARKSQGYFSRIWNLRSLEVENFDVILKNLNANNPESLMKTFQALEEFEKNILIPITPLWKRIGRSIASVFWSLGVGTAAGFGGLTIGAIIGTGLFPIVGTVIGGLVGLAIGQTTDWLVRQKPWQALKLSYVSFLGSMNALAIGPALGAIAGSFIPIPIVGTVVGYTVGALIGAGLGLMLNQLLRPLIVKFFKKPLIVDSPVVVNPPVINPALRPFISTPPTVIPEPAPAMEPSRFIGNTFGVTLRPEEILENKATNNPPRLNSV